MLKKFLRDAVNLIVGKQAEEIVDLLDTNNHINEFILAKKLDITINQTRNILYKMSDYGLVSSIRKKDKKKGWYTYFWKIEVLKSLEFVKSDIFKKINQLENQIQKRETKRFYICKRCNIELNEENALIHNFICRECGDVLMLKDNTKVVREMKKNLDKLKRDLDFVEEEIKKETEKIEKKKLKELKKEERARKRKLKMRRKRRKEKKTSKKTKTKIKKAKKKVKKPKIKKKKSPSSKKQRKKPRKKVSRKSRKKTLKKKVKTKRKSKKLKKYK